MRFATFLVTLLLVAGAAQGAIQNLQVTQVNEVSEKMYNIIPILGVLLVLYLGGVALYKKNIISVLLHRRIWNVFLLVAFLVTGVLGLLLALQIDYAFRIPLARPLFWHVEFGIAMAMISVFHIFWHLNYFRCFFTRKRGD